MGSCEGQGHQNLDRIVGIEARGRNHHGVAARRLDSKLSLAPASSKNKMVHNHPTGSGLVPLNGST